MSLLNAYITVPHIKFVVGAIIIFLTTTIYPTYIGGGGGGLYREIKQLGREFNYTQTGGKYSF
jgi:hypothetical protein